MYLNQTLCDRDIEIQLFHVTKKNDPSGRPTTPNPGGEGYTRKGEPKPLPPKGAPETPPSDPNINKSVVHRTQKHTLKTFIPSNLKKQGEPVKSSPRDNNQN